MNKKFLTFVSCCVIGTILQAGGYLYLDQVLFAPLSSSDYGVSDVKDKNTEALDKAGRKIFSKITVKGKAYYSHDYHYMADVTADSVTIYNSDSLNTPQKVDLKGQGVSFFEWMPDRNLALMAMYPIHWKGGRWDVTLARYNPEGTTHESDAPIKDLPRNAKIVDVAYSTATNAVYMKMEVETDCIVFIVLMQTMIPAASMCRHPISVRLPFFMMKINSSTMTASGALCIFLTGMTAAGALFLRPGSSGWLGLAKIKRFTPLK